MRPEGIFCPAGGFFIDPMRRVARAVVTHGHADHLRRGMGELTATPETIAIADVRIGRGGYGDAAPLPYHKRRQMGDATVWLAPAGHCLGSGAGGDRSPGQGGPSSQAIANATQIPVARLSRLCPAIFSSLRPPSARPVWRFPPPQTQIARLMKSLRLFPAPHAHHSRLLAGKSAASDCRTASCRMDRPDLCPPRARRDMSGLSEGGRQSWPVATR